MYRMSFLTILVLSAQPAPALDFGNGFSVIGYTYVESVDGGSGSEEFIGGDVTLTWRAQTAGSLSFGATLTVDGVRILEDDENLTNVWGGLLLTTGFGEFTIGTPRPILDTWLETPKLGGSEIFDLQITSGGFLFNSYLATVTLLDSVGLNEIYGISFVGNGGAFEYGVGIHSLESELTFIELAGRYRLGQTEFYGGYENVQVDGSSDGLETLTIGATYDTDQFMLGVQAKNASAGALDQNSFKLFGEYNLTSSLAFGAQLVDSDAFPDSFYGLNAEYTFGGDFSGGATGYVNVGYINLGESADEVMTASLGLRF